MHEETKVILAITRVLETLSVPYYLGGSWAVSAYGFPRSTLDVDIIADLKAKHVDPLVTALKSQFYINPGLIRKARRLQHPFSIFHLAHFFKVDLFSAGSSPFKRIQMSRRQKVPLEPDLPTQVYFCSSEDIILEKLAWFHLGGKTSERQWLDVRGVLKVQQPTLDYDYLRQWAGELGVAGLLACAMDEAFGEGYTGERV